MEISEIAELQKKFDDLVKTLTDQKIARLEERVKNAEDLALHPTDGKGVLDVVSRPGPICVKVPRRPVKN